MSGQRIRQLGSSVCLIAVTLAASLPAQQVGDTAARKTVLDEVVVTATRTEQSVRAVPANVIVLTRQSARMSASNTVADFLRLIPGFAMKDAQSSIVASPSREAPAFRGLGGTSASRTLVLVDGVPLNDPFSGWIYWGRVPPGLVERVEVIRGGGAGVWGDRALGGVINLVTVDPADSRLDLSLEGGTYGTIRANLTGAYRKNRLGVVVSGDYFDTDGYPVVRPDLRGPIDVAAYNRDRVGYGRVTYDFTPNVRAFVAGSYLNEHRRSGTPLRLSGAEVSDLRGGLRVLTNGGSLFNLKAYTIHHGSHGFSTSESPDRRTETPSINQFDIPSSAFGTTLQWSRLAFQRHHLSAGTDLSWVDGGVHEDLSYQQGRFTRRREVNAGQLVSGVYLEDAVTLGAKWRLLASTRFDRWQNRDGRRVERDLVTSNVLIDSTFTNHTETNVSYSVGLRHDLSAAFSWRTSVYRSFRLPTLNELYRPFREAGNVITEANPLLGPEHLLGAELGADLNLGAHVLTRITAFWSKVNNPIFEATVATAGSTGRTIAPCGFVPAGGTCRQRQNLGSLRTRGIEAELEVHPHQNWSFWGGYTWNPTTLEVASSPAPLQGKWAKGTARHQFTVIASYDNPAIVAVAVTGRYVGARFDDDINTLPLDHFFVADLRVNRRIFQNATAFVKVENLFDAMYPATRAASGLVRVGGPRFAMGGIRVEW